MLGRKIRDIVQQQKVVTGILHTDAFAFPKQESAQVEVVAKQPPLNRRTC